MAGYRVQASKACGVGRWSVTASISVALVPAIPTGIYISDQIFAKIEKFTAHWDAVPTATRYEIMRYETGVVVYSGTATLYVVESGFYPLIQQYNYQFRACNAAGCSN